MLAGKQVCLVCPPSNGLHPATVGGVARRSGITERSRSSIEKVIHRDLTRGGCVCVLLITTCCAMQMSTSASDQGDAGTGRLGRGWPSRPRPRNDERSSPVRGYHSTTLCSCTAVFVGAQGGNPTNRVAQGATGGHHPMSLTSDHGVLTGAACPGSYPHAAGPARQLGRLLALAIEQRC